LIAAGYRTAPEVGPMAAMLTTAALGKELQVDVDVQTARLEAACPGITGTPTASRTATPGD